MNKVIISGMVNEIPSYQTTQSGKGLLKFNISVRRDYKNKDGRYENDYFRVTAFGATADYATKNIDKGTIVNVEGKLQTSSYEKNGIKQYITDIIASSIEVPYGKHAIELVRQWNKEREARQNGENYSGQPDAQQLRQAQKKNQQQSMKDEGFVEVEDDNLPF